MPKTSGLMRVLQVITYKSYPVYIRMIGYKTFIWDVIFENQLYSSYMEISAAKGKSRLTKAEVDEVVKMCYAGAAATVDGLLGIELEDKEADIVARFEGARAQIEAKPLVGQSISEEIH